MIKVEIQLEAQVPINLGAYPLERVPSLTGSYSVIEAGGHFRVVHANPRAAFLFDTASALPLQISFR